MAKRDLINTFAEKASITKKDAAVYFDALVDTIEETVLSGEKVQLLGFGTFDVVERPERVCRNPQTGETMTVGPRKALRFKSSVNMKAALNE